MNADPQSRMVDWEFAAQTARALMRPGPEISATQAADVVAELRDGAAQSEQPVRDYTGLHARSATAPVVVVDRAGWIQANIEGFETVMQPLVDKITDAKKRKGPPPKMVRAVGSKVSGAEVGALLAFMSGKVLGQFDPFWDGDGSASPADQPTTGRMLLVAPNIVAIERDLDVDSGDFRLWVCLHEETHRVQFTAVPWMRDHMHELIDDFVGATDLDPEGISKMLGDGAAQIGKMLRGDPDVSLMDLMQNPAQREVVDKLTGVMSLLEGHADVVMDGVGPSVIPSVDKIRKRFNQRRKGAGGLDQLLRRLLGLDAKMKQYRDGAAFVRTVTDKVGHDGFNAVWTSAEQLPSKTEITDPDSWVARVHG